MRGNNNKKLGCVEYDYDEHKSNKALLHPYKQFEIDSPESVDGSRQKTQTALP